LFDSADEATAQEVLDKINSGELDFAEAAQQYSKDSSAQNGGDVGWDKMTSFVEPYQTALDGLAVDQVSGLVTTDYGIHIIKCTDEFNAPKTT
ncbi:peptidylprolyl isomerase, partial [Klebsiella pneumoniae]|uniref:peptidylprolyl isomerase n=1 Tax=Klebsiella pneumoniae TaxID=573 RepID=UPI0034E966F6